jgi:hypothetical protein
MTKIEAYEWDRTLEYNGKKCRNYSQIFIFSDKYEKKQIEEGTGGLLGNWKKLEITLETGVILKKETYQWESSNVETFYEVLFANV